jgi:hypothetical protein
METDLEQQFKKISTRSVRVTVPEIFWDEWQADCKENFNDTYFLKMKFDHEFRKQFTTVANSVIIEMQSQREEIERLKEEIMTLKDGMREKEEQPTKKVVKTMGGILRTN